MTSQAQRELRMGDTLADHYRIRQQSGAVLTQDQQEYLQTWKQRRLSLVAAIGKRDQLDATERDALRSCRDQIKALEQRAKEPASGLTTIRSKRPKKSKVNGQLVLGILPSLIQPKG